MILQVMGLVAGPEGGESGKCLEDGLGLLGVSAEQTAVQCRP